VIIGKLHMLEIDDGNMLILTCRLLDYKTQERYYTKIIERYMAFCSAAGKSDELLRRLASLNLSSTATTPPPSTTQSATPTRVNSSPIQNGTLPSPTSSTGIATITMSMRKLREGIVASHRIDAFSTQVYIFCIRLSILTKTPESYHPALLHLLRRMHTTLPLSSTEVQEFAGYMIIDLACRQHDLSQAYEVRNRYKVKDAKIDCVLKALTHDDYWLFWKVKGSVDGYKVKLMEWAEEGVRRQALKCLGRAYFGMDLRGLEMYTGEKWDMLVKEYGVGWIREGEKVVIRKPKTK
jgi:hypothetical protein